MLCHMQLIDGTSRPGLVVLSTRPPTRTEIHALLKNRMVMKSEFVVLSRQKSTLFDFYFYST